MIWGNRGVLGSQALPSTERFGTIFNAVFGRTLKFRKAPDDRLCLVARGPSDTVSKVAKQQRLRRGLKSLRKTFSDARSQKFRNFVAKHLTLPGLWGSCKLPEACGAGVPGQHQ
eukprot:2064889-Amphidinium_carterae.1